jgi:hypothetical protein
MGQIADQLTRMLMSGAERAVYDLAHEVLERARRDAPPTPPPGEDPSAASLRESGHVRRVKGGVEIVFDVPYAAKQHENMRLAHPHGGGPKFLERNVLAAARELPKAIAGQVRANTGEGMASGGSRHSTSF